MNKLIVAMALAIVGTLSLTAYSDGVQSDLQSNLIRLHIIANSDSEEDQGIKLTIRDAVLKEEGKNLTSQNEQACIRSVKERLPQIERLANSVLQENGFPYAAHAVYGKFDFPKKEYKNMTLPSGKYYGVRIILGEGAGHNWWCVMYPPLCMMNDTEAVLSEKSERILKENLKPETYDIITGNDGKTEVKFKIVEVIQELRQRLG